jgi:hypothetical protein
MDVRTTTVADRLADEQWTAAKDGLPPMIGGGERPDGEMAGTAITVTHRLSDGGQVDRRVSAAINATGVRHDAGGGQRHRRTVRRRARCRWLSAVTSGTSALLDGAHDVTGLTGVPFDGTHDLTGAYDVGGFRSEWALRACCFMARTARPRSGPTGALFVGADDAGGLPSGGRRGAFDGGAEPCRTGVHGHPVTCPHTEIWRLGLRHLNYGLRHA